MYVCSSLQTSVCPLGQSSSVRKKPTEHPFVIQRANSCPSQPGEPLPMGGTQKSGGDFQVRGPWHRIGMLLVFGIIIQEP